MVGLLACGAGWVFPSTLVVVIVVIMVARVGVPRVVVVPVPGVVVPLP